MAQSSVKGTGVDSNAGTELTISIPESLALVSLQKAQLHEEIGVILGVIYINV